MPGVFLANPFPSCPQFYLIIPSLSSLSLNCRCEWSSTAVQYARPVPFQPASPHSSLLCVFIGVPLSIKSFTRQVYNSHNVPNRNIKPLINLNLYYFEKFWGFRLLAFLLQLTYACSLMLHAESRDNVSEETVIFEVTIYRSVRLAHPYLTSSLLGA